jgi:nitrogen PTS system EIIA component
MNIKEFLSPSDVVVDLRARDKHALLKGLSSRAAGALKLSTEAVEDAIVRRDELGSTGIGRGVCIPHARFREVKKPFGFLARLRQPIEFEAIDGQPVDIVFLLLLPALSQIDQLNALAAVARKLRDPKVLRQLREARDAAALYAAATT